MRSGGAEIEFDNRHTSQIGFGYRLLAGQASFCWTSRTRFYLLTANRALYFFLRCLYRRSGHFVGVDGAATYSQHWALDSCFRPRSWLISRDNNVMHAKSGLRVVLKFKDFRPDSVIAAVIPLRHEIYDTQIDGTCRRRQRLRFPLFVVLLVQS